MGYQLPTKMLVGVTPKVIMMNSAEHPIYLRKPGQTLLDVQKGEGGVLVFPRKRLMFSSNLLKTSEPKSREVKADPGTG